jgi:hypothetical protein
MISDACDRPVEQCRIWHFARRQNGSFRQEIPISEKSDADTMVATFNHHAKGLYELRLWLEVSDSKIQDSDGRIAFFHNISSNDRITLFVKYFDPTVAELKYAFSQYTPTFITLTGL